MLTKGEIAEVLAKAKKLPVSQIGGNSTVTRVISKGRIYAVKNYAARDDGRQRLIQEFSALRVVHLEMPNSFAKPLGLGASGLQAVYSWLNGVRPTLNEFTVSHMVKLLKDLHAVSFKVEKRLISPATDRVLELGDIINQIDSRVSVLITQQREIAELTSLQIIPLLEQLSNRSRHIGNPTITLSPSDFGAHNLLWDDSDQMMRCVDLEFFGWDDAHKLICDTLLHPLANWDTNYAKLFVSGACDVYEFDKKRLLSLWPYFGLKWATITLARASQNLLAGNRASAEQAIQHSMKYIDYVRYAPSSLRDIVFQVSTK